MNRNTRRRFTGIEKVAILKRHLVDRVPISDLCEEHQLHPNLFYTWQKLFFENGAQAFEKQSNRAASSQEKRLTRMKEKIAEKDTVISELVTELIKSKKNDGDL